MLEKFLAYTLLALNGVVVADNYISTPDLAQRNPVKHSASNSGTYFTFQFPPTLTTVNKVTNVSGGHQWNVSSGHQWLLEDGSLAASSSTA